jgi:peptide/nickel transport system substrate-binding protein
LTIGAVGPNGTPTAIFPITNGGDSATPSQNLVSNLFIPLFYGPDGSRPQVNYALSLAAGAPVASDGDKTFTITLKSGVKWSDGTAVTSTDLLF